MGRIRPIDVVWAVIIDFQSFSRIARRLALVVAFSVVRAHAADTLRCGSRLVGIETPQAEVQALCGAPSYRDHRIESRSRYGNTYDEADIWYYNDGPNQLIRVLIFRDGKLAEIHSDGYGFAPRSARTCRPSDIVTGMSKYRLVMTCGEPLSKQAMNITAPLLVGPQPGLPRGAAYSVPVYREEWVYNFGSNYFLHTVVIENGVVTEIHTGERGFDPH
jgi:hypothetical protein